MNRLQKMKRRKKLPVKAQLNFAIETQWYCGIFLLLRQAVGIKMASIVTGFHLVLLLMIQNAGEEAFIVINERNVTV